MGGKRATETVTRHLIMLKAWSIVPDDNGLFIVPDSVPLSILRAVEYVCDNSDMDWRYAGD